MQIIIATDGNLDTDLTAELAGRLFEQGDTVTIATVVEVPRTLLTDLRGFFRNPPPTADIDEDHEYVGQPTAGTLTSHWPGDDAMIARYVADQSKPFQSAGSPQPSRPEKAIPRRAQFWSWSTSSRQRSSSSGPTDEAGSRGCSVLPGPSLPGWRRVP